MIRTCLFNPVFNINQYIKPLCDVITHSSRLDFSRISSSVKKLCILCCLFEVEDCKVCVVNLATSSWNNKCDISEGIWRVVCRFCNRLVVPRFIRSSLGSLKLPNRSRNGSNFIIAEGVWCRLNERKTVSEHTKVCINYLGKQASFFWVYLIFDVFN